MQLVRAPKQFDVLVTGNIFGDILSDTTAMLTGSIGMLPSASLNAESGAVRAGTRLGAGYCGRGPGESLATILSVAMLLRYSLDAPEAAVAVEQAVAHVLDAGLRTADIAAPGEQAVGTRAMGDAVIDALQAKGGDE